jgi:hypothetical protein
MTRHCTEHHASRQAVDKNGLHYCRECNRLSSLVWAANNRERTRSNTLKRVYDITPQQYAELLSQQNGVCAICENLCRTKRKLAVDHDRRTGKVRGLLCFDCNTALGKLDHDIEILMNAIAYLEGDK